MKHFTRGGSGLLMTPRVNDHSLSVTRLKTRTRYSFLTNPRRLTQPNRGVGDNSSVGQSRWGKCLAERTTRKNITVCPKLSSHFLQSGLDRATRALGHSGTFSLLTYTGGQQESMTEGKLSHPSIGCVEVNVNTEEVTRRGVQDTFILKGRQQG